MTEIYHSKLSSEFILSINVIIYFKNKDKPIKIGVTKIVKIKKEVY